MLNSVTITCSRANCWLAVTGCTLCWHRSHATDTSPTPAAADATEVAAAAADWTQTWWLAPPAVSDVDAGDVVDDVTVSLVTVDAAAGAPPRRHRQHQIYSRQRNNAAFDALAVLREESEE